LYTDLALAGSGQPLRPGPRVTAESISGSDAQLSRKPSSTRSRDQDRDVRSPAECAPNRYLFGKVEAGHNVHMQWAEEVYAFVRRHFG